MRIVSRDEEKVKVGKVGDLCLAEKGQGSQIIMLSSVPFLSMLGDPEERGEVERVGGDTVGSRWAGGVGKIRYVPM